MSGPVVVLGSVNVDLVVEVDRLPAAGETVLGGDTLRLPGGKGANQAVALARLGRDVVLVGRVGDDEHGRWLRTGLAAEGVGTSLLATTPDVPSGTALITVARGGDNTIVVSPGANAHVTPAGLVAPGVLTALAAAPAVLVQLEVPIATVAALVDHLPARPDGLLILNPAPAPDGPLPGALLARVDVLVPNRSELGRLAGVPEPTTHAAVTAAVEVLRQAGFGGDVVVTLGADGALVVTRDGTATHVPSVPVDAVDPTGAGDAFCGALTDRLAAGEDLLAATRTAVVAGALATTAMGAQAALPDRDAITRRRDG
jgi:ribokinase